MTDLQWPDLLIKAEEARNRTNGGDVYQKWTCTACGQRCSSDKPNEFNHRMRHEGCPVDPGHETDCVARGGGLLVIAGGG